MAFTYLLTIIMIITTTFIIIAIIITNISLTTINITTDKPRFHYKIQLKASTWWF